jgi:3-oxoacyl-[acyl-carrier-protein] synthase-1
MKLKSWVKIKPTSVELNGRQLSVKESGSALLTELYRTYVNDYPKFFKMDELSKLGFIASELLLHDEPESYSEQEDRAVILFNKSGSICSDRKYQETIRRDDDFYPSPSIFVYTLPNIVTGEIAIRHHYYGETAFYVLNEHNQQLMDEVLTAAFADGVTKSAITGWLDCATHDSFDAHIYIVEK